MEVTILLFQQDVTPPHSTNITTKGFADHDITISRQILPSSDLDLKEMS